MRNDYFIKNKKKRDKKLLFNLILLLIMILTLTLLLAFNVFGSKEDNKNKEKTSNIIIYSAKENQRL